LKDGLADGVSVLIVGNAADRVPRRICRIGSEILKLHARVSHSGIVVAEQNDPPLLQ